MVSSFGSTKPNVKMFKIIVKCPTINMKMIKVFFIYNWIIDGDFTIAQ